MTDVVVDLFAGHRLDNVIRVHIFSIYVKQKRHPSY